MPNPELHRSGEERNLSTGRAAGLALFAALALSFAGTSPAAARSDWQAACDFKAAPQGYGDSIRYSNCMRQDDCQKLADAAGRTIFEAGCFGISPEAPADPRSGPHRR